MRQPLPETGFRLAGNGITHVNTVHSKIINGKSRTVSTQCGFFYNSIQWLFSGGSSNKQKILNAPRSVCHTQ
jgi:hypothetical protein